MNTLCCGYVGDISGDYRGSNRGLWVATSTQPSTLPCKCEGEHDMCLCVSLFP
jgi:hypothetical protein